MTMRSITLAFILMAASSGLFASDISDIEVSVGIHAGFYPEMGGNLQSFFQSDTLDAPDGIYDINRTENGKETSFIKPLLGRYAGLNTDITIRRHFIIRTSLNFSKDYYGGRGTSLDHLDDEMDVRYKLTIIDFPIAAGLAVPVRDRVKISLCAGIAVAYGKYQNSFESANISSSGTFSAWGAPFVIMLKGEIFLTENISLSSSVNTYQGATGPVRSGDDYARIDFSGIRWDIGAAYHFDTDIKFRRRDN